MQKDIKSILDSLIPATIRSRDIPILIFCLNTPILNNNLSQM